MGKVIELCLICFDTITSGDFGLTSKNNLSASVTVYLP